MRLGVHVPADAPLAEAEARGAEVVQIFLTAPQSYDKPPQRDDQDELLASDVPIYVHAPYLINVATPVNRVRHPSRQNLTNTMRGAERIGAAGVVVHGGHVGEDDDPEIGFENWRKTLERLSSPVPILIENTAGGENAMSREVARIERLWEVLDGIETPIGLCLDTCHLHAAGQELLDGVARMAALPGGIQLVHCNDSKDEFGSSRDRHENLGAGMIDGDLIAAVVAASGAPDLVCETPGDVNDHLADLAWLRARLA